MLGTSWLAIRTGLADMPANAGWSHVTGVALLCGIGFTMSLFIGALSFDASHFDLQVANRVGILAGSLLSAIAGYLLLAWILPKKPG